MRKLYLSLDVLPDEFPDEPLDELAVLDDEAAEMDGAEEPEVLDDVDGAAAAAGAAPLGSVVEEELVAESLEPASAFLGAAEE